MGRADFGAASATAAGGFKALARAAALQPVLTGGVLIDCQCQPFWVLQFSRRWHHFYGGVVVKFDTI